MTSYAPHNISQNTSLNPINIQFQLDALSEVG